MDRRLSLTLEQAAVSCRGYRDELVPTRGSNAIYAMLFPLGTLAATSDTTWSWTLCAHMDKVKEAGVDFDPEARTLTSVQGIASSGSALQVSDVLFGAHRLWHVWPHAHVAQSDMSNKDEVISS